MSFQGNTSIDSHLVLGRALLQKFYEEVHPRNVEGVEYPFAVTLPNPNTGDPLDVSLVGVIDLIESDDEGNLIIAELKTSSKRYAESQGENQLDGMIYVYAKDQLGFRTTSAETLIRYDVLVKTKSPAFQQIYCVLSAGLRSRERALAVADHQDIEDALIDAVDVPDEIHSVSVSLDRVSVPMEEPRRRPAGRPKKGAPKKPVERNYRMAYCGTVTLHDEKGTGWYTVRYGCMPDGDVLGLRNRMVADVATLRSKRSDLKIQLLCDGAPEMWNLLEDSFKPKFGDDLHRLVDFYHVTEKLGAVARILDDTTAAAEQRLGRWKTDLLKRGRAATDILQELIALGRDEGAGADHPVHEAITYLQNHGSDGNRMNYARARRLGLPLGSGNVEATCKSLFEMRMKRCGARWKEETGQHIVQLRALALSDRWEPAIELTLRPLRMAVRAASQQCPL